MSPEVLSEVVRKVEESPLEDLLRVSIDEVQVQMDSYLEPEIDSASLYRRWEKQQWAVSDLDFEPDRQNWATLSEDEKKYVLWTMRLFFNGEERVTATLAPFVWAAPTPEIEIFLSTQMVDEARHSVFFDTWWRAVPGTDKEDMASLLDDVRPTIAGGYNELFYDRLPAIAQRLANNPKDLEALVEGVTMYHIVIEATLALTGQRFTLDQMRQEGNTGLGFYQGFTAVARDESRHVNFGIKFLQEAIRDDADRFAPLVQRTLVDCLPLITGTLEPPEGDQRYYTDFGRSQDEVMEYAMSSLNRRLQAIGINLAA